MLIYIILTTKGKKHTSRLSTGMKNLYIKGLCKSSLNYTNIWAIPLVGSDNSIGPPVCPIHIIAKECNGKWMWQHFMASHDFPVIRTIIKCCVNGIWPTEITKKSKDSKVTGTKEERQEFLEILATLFPTPLDKIHVPKIPLSWATSIQISSHNDTVVQTSAMCGQQQNTFESLRSYNTKWQPRTM